MPFHMHSLMSSVAHLLDFLDRIIAMSTSAADVIGTCASAQEVQFKRILAADLDFWQYASTQTHTAVVFGMHHSRRAWALLRQVKTNSLFSR
jgi:hypothetical protein